MPLPFMLKFLPLYEVNCNLFKVGDHVTNGEGRCGKVVGTGFGPATQVLVRWDSDTSYSITSTGQLRRV